jgi:hypothetical protein
MSSGFAEGQQPEVPLAQALDLVAGCDSQEHDQAAAIVVPSPSAAEHLNWAWASLWTGSWCFGGFRGRRR